MAAESGAAASPAWGQRRDVPTAERGGSGRALAQEYPRTQSVLNQG